MTSQKNPFPPRIRRRFSDGVCTASRIDELHSAFQIGEELANRSLVIDRHGIIITVASTLPSQKMELGESEHWSDAWCSLANKVRAVSMVEHDSIKRTGTAGDDESSIENKVEADGRISRGALSIIADQNDGVQPGEGIPTTLAEPFSIWTGTELKDRRKLIAAEYAALEENEAFWNVMQE